MLEKKTTNSLLTTAAFQLAVVVHIPVGLLHRLLHQKLDLKPGAHPADLRVDALGLGLAILEEVILLALVSKIIVRRSFARPAFFWLPSLLFELCRQFVIVTVRVRLISVLLLRGLPRDPMVLISKAVSGRMQVFPRWRLPVFVIPVRFGILMRLHP